MILSYISAEPQHHYFTIYIKSPLKYTAVIFPQTAGKTLGLRPKSRQGTYSLHPFYIFDFHPQFAAVGAKIGLKPIFGDVFGFARCVAWNISSKFYATP
jgi:hypothetical protein